MSSSEVKMYATPMKCLIPKGFRLQDDAVALISSIIYELNNSFIDTISDKNKDVREIRAKNVEASIKPLIPTELWRCIAASGSNAVLRFHSGCITYEAPKSYKIGYLEPRTLKKGTEELAEIAHSNLILSRNFCTLITNEMQRLAVYIADNSIGSMTDDPHLSLQNLKQSLRDILGQELSSHAAIRADNCLEMYRTNKLDLNLKWLRPPKTTSTPTKVAEGCKIFSRGVQKLAKSHVKGLLAKDASFKVEKCLKEVLDKILENAKTESNLEESEAITERSIRESVENLIPDILFRHSSAHAQTNTMRYRSGILKYKHEIPAAKRTKKEEMEAETKPKGITTDYGSFITLRMENYQSSASKEFLAKMNKILNDLSYALAGKCSESAKRSDGPISGKDVIHSVNELLSHDIKKHAFARIRYVQENLVLPGEQVRIDHQNPMPNEMYSIDTENMDID